MKIEARKFDFNNVDALTDKQVNEHYKLYVKYVDKTNETMNILSTQADVGLPNSTYSFVRGVKEGETYAYNAVKLHEYYFENLGKASGACSGKISEMINRDFGSYANFEKKFKDVAESVRGWAVLSYDNCYKKLHICGMDTHDKGTVVDTIPLAVVDMYEHAYFMDYGVDRPKYLTNVMTNLDWQVVNKRLDKVLTSESVMA